MFLYLLYSGQPVVSGGLGQTATYTEYVRGARRTKPFLVTGPLYTKRRMAEKSTALPRCAGFFRMKATALSGSL